MSLIKTVHVGLAQLALALGGFAIGTGEYVIMGLLPDVAHGLHTSITRAGDAITGYALGVVLGAPLIAVLFARFSRQRLLIWLMVIFALGNLASALASNYLSFVLMRFITGLPHGAYFGVASLVAASMVPAHQRGKAIGRMMLGLTLATLIGVPMVAWIGHHLNWQLAFWFAGGCAVLSLLLVIRFVPFTPGNADAHPLRELTALKKPQVLLTLLTGATGFGGMFAVFSYITPTMIHRAGMSEAHIPWVMAAFGVGMIVGSLLGGRFADWSVRKTIGLSLVWNIVVMVLFLLLSQYLLSGFLAAFLIGTVGLLIPSLQIRLMDVAGDAQTLAAAMNHSALNMANALGAFLSGVVIDAGFGWDATAWVGMALGLCGLVIFLMSLRCKNPHSA